MKNILCFFLVSVLTGPAFASTNSFNQTSAIQKPGAKKNSSADLVFKCTRILSDGESVYVHINNDESQFVSSLGTYDVGKCSGQYHSCWSVVDESGWGFNYTLLGLYSTGNPNILELKGNGDRLMEGVICKKML